MNHVSERLQTQICRATADVLARLHQPDPEILRSLLDACAIACAACAAECDRHSAQMEHCRVCAEACRACESACREVLRAPALAP